MVIRGRIRGNGKQLANYLLSQGENEQIQILDVDGKQGANDNDLFQTLISMSLTSELTKSDKGLYHVQINPAYGEDKAMTMEDWLQCAQLLEKETGFEFQRRVIVLHTKKDRTHAHIVFERYDHEKGIMKSDSYSRLAQDRARQAMEVVLNHERTPERNPRRPEMKKTLTELWNRTKSGKEFIQEAEKQGYVIAAGLQRRPFMVVDSEGRSFDLVRQLDGIRTRQVRERLDGEKLIEEKRAIEKIRSKQKQFERQVSNDNQSKEKAARMFAESRSDMVKDDPQRKMKERQKDKKDLFNADKDEIMKKEKESKLSELAKSFAANKSSMNNSGTKKKEKGLDFDL